MLTDYHVHLRPDGPDTPASRYFTAGNADRYRAVASERGIEELGVAEHVYRFAQALDVWDHPLWRASACDDLDEYCAFVREETDLRLGVEADFVFRREDQMATLLEAREWDYVVGSVHFVGEEAVDHPDYDVWQRRGHEPARVWAEYFELLGEAAASGLFDVLAHPDLVKFWGDRRPRPEGDPRRFYERAMEGIADSGIAVELSTAGLRKPVGAMYPDRAFLEMVVDAGNPIALSSDAHTPEQLGHEYGRAVALLRELGVEEIAVFEGRRRRLEPLGEPA
ncbi:MAG TPA: histidinol-phosphatase HisJ family protein [Solirubrobacteraceae bacterium]|nr:histidinol-phosphatase HisJ family protein [Solirubrobacteraceae bacterium]